jgi:hypothetical protein
VQSDLSSVKAQRAAHGSDPGRLCTLRRRCNADQRDYVPAMSLASWLAAKRIARRGVALRASATDLLQLNRDTAGAAARCRCNGRRA